MAKKPPAEYQGVTYENTTPLRAIRAKCLDCAGGQPKEVRLCPAKLCSLWPFRMKKNPFISRGSEEEEDDVEDMSDEEKADLLAELNGEDDDTDPEDE